MIPPLPHAEKYLLLPLFFDSKLFNGASRHRCTSSHNGLVVNNQGIPLRVTSVTVIVSLFID